MKYTLLLFFASCGFSKDVVEKKNISKPFTTKKPLLNVDYETVSESRNGIDMNNSVEIYYKYLINKIFYDFNQDKQFKKLLEEVKKLYESTKFIRFNEKRQPIYSDEEVVAISQTKVDNVNEDKDKDQGANRLKLIENKFIEQSHEIIFDVFLGKINSLVDFLTIEDYDLLSDYLKSLESSKNKVLIENKLVLVRKGILLQYLKKENETQLRKEDLVKIINKVYKTDFDFENTSIEKIAKELDLGDELLVAFNLSILKSISGNVRPETAINELVSSLGIAEELLSMMLLSESKFTEKDLEAINEYLFPSYPDESKRVEILKVYFFKTLLLHSDSKIGKDQKKIYLYNAIQLERLNSKDNAFYFEEYVNSLKLDKSKRIELLKNYIKEILELNLDENVNSIEKEAYLYNAVKIGMLIDGDISVKISLEDLAKHLKI